LPAVEERQSAVVVSLRDGQYAWSYNVSCDKIDQWQQQQQPKNSNAGYRYAPVLEN